MLLVALIVVLIIAVLFYKSRPTVVVFKSCADSKLLGPNAPPLKEVNLKVDYEELNLDKGHPIGTGSFGVVYKGMYDNKRVAVKVLSPAFQVCFMGCTAHFPDHPCLHITMFMY